jgi:hypothetical protein
MRFNALLGCGVLPKLCLGVMSVSNLELRRQNYSRCSGRSEVGGIALEIGVGSLGFKGSRIVQRPLDGLIGTGNVHKVVDTSCVWVFAHYAGCGSGIRKPCSASAS